MLRAIHAILESLHFLLPLAEYLRLVKQVRDLGNQATICLIHRLSILDIRSEFADVVFPAVRNIPGESQVPVMPDPNLRALRLLRAGASGATAATGSKVGG
jgi:hypothetical protein